MWFNCCYYNNPYVNYFMPFFNYRQNIIMTRNFMPSIWQLHNPYHNTQIYQTPIKQIQETADESILINPEAEELIHGVKYNKEKGALLAKNIIEGLPSYRDPQNPLCARYVKKAMVKSGFGPYINGNAQYCKNILRANENFKEVKVKGEELASLPVGTIIIYDAFEKGSDNNGEIKQVGKDGHIVVALVDGKAGSDLIEDYILKTDRAYTFIPV